MPVTIFNALDEAAQTILGEETRNNVREWLRRAWHHNVCPAIEAAPPAPPAPLPGKESLTLSPPGNYIQTVPDHCDRIIWRGRYWALPIKSIDTPVSPTLEAAPADYPPLPKQHNWRGYYPEDMRAYVDEDRAQRSGVSADPLPCPQPSAQGPAELWLQLHGDCHESEFTQPVDYTSEDVTWCWHRIHESDVRYVRADTDMQAEIDRMSDALREIGDFAHDRSTGPAVPDALWEVRSMAYSAESNITSPQHQVKKGEPS